MKKVAVVGIVMLLFAITFTAQAAEFQFAHEKNDRNVDIPQQETHKNLYAVGASVDINGNTQGDLVAAGATVVLNGNIEKDLDTAGGNLNVNGSVGANARVAGGNVTVNGPVTGDLLVGGGNVAVTEKASVGGDLLLAGGNLTLDSQIKGKADLYGGTVTINGKVDGDLTVRANKELTFGPNSEVKGKITYNGPTEAVIQTGAKVGTINYTKTNAQRMLHPNGIGAIFALLLISSIFKFLMLLVFALALAWLFPAKIASTVSNSLSKPWHNLGWGLLTLIVSPVVAFLLCISVVGLYIGMAIFAIWFLLVLSASVLSLFYTGALLWSWFKKKDPANRWRDLLVGAIMFIILSIIPIVGWIALLLLFLIPLGALATHIFMQNREV